MELTPVFNLIIAAIILLLVAFVYIGFQIKNLAAEIETAAYKLYFELTRKDDLLPSLIEKLSQYVARDSFNEVIKERALSMSNSSIGNTKKAQEEKLWQSVGELWETATKSEAKKDVALIALSKNLKEADERIADNTKAYNSMVKKYNGLAGNLLLKPASLIVKAKKAEMY